MNTAAQNAKQRVRIGGACGFWGDSAMATPQLLQVPGLQYLVYDYLAETTMAILARARAKDPALGYATDFVHAVMTPHLQAIHSRGIKVIANAGGLNPEGCRDALLQVAHAQGIALRVAVVTGDDLMPQMAALHAQGVRTSTNTRTNTSTSTNTSTRTTANVPLTTHPLPENPLSANAYVGARGIAQALAAGADVVITGRCVDSAVVLGVLVHEWGWSWQDWDRLSAGTLAGHLIECGAQATGGLFTDWQDVPDWANIGYPVIDVAEDGSLELFKPEGTGGLIHPGAVAEQILYEVGDPAHYLMPDVCCDWREVQVARAPSGTVNNAVNDTARDTVRDSERDTVRVSGARGRPAPTHYKANATWQDGYQLQLMMAIRGIDAPRKAERTAQALLTRSRQLMAQQGYSDYSETCVELLGGESHYGPHAQAHTAREVVLRIAVRHAQAKALAVLQRECASSGTSMGPGTRSSFFGRADIQPVIKLCSFLVPKTQVRLQMQLGEVVQDASEHALLDTNTTSVTPMPALAPTFTTAPTLGSASPSPALDTREATQTATANATDEALRDCRLIDLAWARSGDKGDDENIGVIARHDRAWDWLRTQLQADQVQAYFSHLVQGPVLRYEVPGLQALNFVLQQALGGGGVCSLRSDPLGKSFAQMLLDMPLRVPASVLAPVVTGDPT